MTQEQLTDFRPDPNNLNKGTERGNYALERSLREYGFARPIVADKEGVILAGNHAFQKAGEIGMKNVRVIETDGTEIIIHKRTDLDADTAKARMIGLVDNRANQLNYQLDEAALASMADNLPDLSNFFNEAEIERLSDASFLDALSDIGGALMTMRPPRRRIQKAWKKMRQMVIKSFTGLASRAHTSRGS